MQTRQAAALALLLPATTLASIINVPADQPTIQAGLNVAVPGDEVVLESNTYSIETGLSFPQSGVTLRGESGNASDVILDAAGSASPITLNNRTGMVFRGLTITNARSPVRVSGGDASFFSCAFTNNESSGSVDGALRALLSTVHVEACLFESNRSTTETAGAAIAAGGAEVTILSSEFRDNSVVLSQGISQSSGAAIFGGVGFSSNGPLTSTIEISETLFIGNTAVLGGAIRNNGGTLTIDRCTFVENAASFGGAILSDSGQFGPDLFSPTTTITSSVFNSNSAFRVGVFNGLGAGIASVSAQSLTVLNGTFVRNESETTSAAIEISDTPDATVANCLLAGNTPSASPIRGTFTGGSNLDATLDSVGFADPSGPDGMPGTPDDDFSLLPGSPAIDAGDSSALPPSYTLDHAGRPRFVDDPATADTGSGPAPVIDIGAHEYAPPAPCNAADLSEIFGVLDLADITAFVSAFLAQDPDADLAPDGLFDLADIVAFVTAFTAGCP